MATTIDKEQLIEAIRETNDDRILFAISRLLQIEEDIPEWHKEILIQRVNDIEEGKAVFHNWEDIKSNLFKAE